MGLSLIPVIFREELENLDKFQIDYHKSLLISRKAHLILPTHRLLDAAAEKSKGLRKLALHSKELDQPIWTKQVAMAFELEI